MKTHLKTTGNGVQKNEKDKMTSPKSKVIYSPRNTAKPNLSSTSQLHRRKSEHLLKTVNSEISTVDMQSKEEAIIEQNVQDSLNNINEDKKHIVKNSKQIIKKQEQLGSKKNTNKQKFSKGKEKDRQTDTKGAQTVLKQMKAEFQKQISEFQEKTNKYEEQMEEKNKTIDQLTATKKQFQEKYEKLQKVHAENKKILKERMIKYNEEGNQTRKLKQRVQELQFQVKSLRTRQQGSTVSVSQAGCEYEFEGSKSKDQFALELKTKLKASSFQNLQKQIQTLKDENYSLRKKLVNSLHHKYDRDKNKEKNIKKKMELLQRTDKILEITRQQKSFLDKIIPQYEKK